MATLYEEKYVAEMMAGGADPVGTAKERNVRPPSHAQNTFPDSTPLFCVGCLSPVIKKRTMPQRIKPQSDTYHDYSEAEIDGGGGMIWEEERKADRAEHWS